MPTEHRLERRSRLLAQRIRESTDRLAKQLGEGDRPPFTRAMTRNESLAWFREHLHDEHGREAVEHLASTKGIGAVMQLYADLNGAMNPLPEEAV